MGRQNGRRASPPPRVPPLQAQIARLFDLFIASHPLMPLYVAAVAMRVRGPARLAFPLPCWMGRHAGAPTLLAAPTAVPAWPCSPCPAPALPPSYLASPSKQPRRIHLQHPGEAQRALCPLCHNYINSMCWLAACGLLAHRPTASSLTHRASSTHAPFPWPGRTLTYLWLARAQAHREQLLACDDASDLHHALSNMPILGAGQPTADDLAQQAAALYTAVPPASLRFAGELHCAPARALARAAHCAALLACAPGNCLRD